jgi:hypothetical protein
MATTASTSGGSQTLASKFLSDVKTDIGDPYVFGAAGPKEFDCSGLIYYNLRRIGITSVPRTSEQQWAWVQHIHKNELQAGDLIFMQFPGDQASPGHVVIYAGNGKIIQAPHTGADVQEVPLSSMGNGSEIVGYGRVPGLTGLANDGGGNNIAPALQATGGMTLTSSPLSTLEQLGKNALSIVSGPGQTVGDVATATAGIANDLGTAMHFLAVLGKPSFWLRIGAFFAGCLSAAFGIYLLGKSLGFSGPQVVPIPV